MLPRYSHVSLLAEEMIPLGMKSRATAMHMPRETQPNAVLWRGGGEAVLASVGKGMF